MKQYIYKITLLKTGKSYIGVTKDLKRRLSQHKHRATYVSRNYQLYKDWNKYGIDNFKIEIVEEFEFTSKEDSYCKESFYINKFNTYNNGYNICKYASSHPGKPIWKNKTFSKEHRKHISENHWNRGNKGLSGGYKNPSAKYYIIKDNLGKTYKFKTRLEIQKGLNLSFKQIKLLIKSKDWYTPKVNNKENKSFKLIEKGFINI